MKVRSVEMAWNIGAGKMMCFTLQSVACLTIYLPLLLSQRLTRNAWEKTTVLPKDIAASSAFSGDRTSSWELGRSPSSSRDCSTWAAGTSNCCANCLMVTSSDNWISVMTGLGGLG